MTDVFRYRARNRTGKLVNGQIQADNINRAAMLLRDKHLVVIDITSVKGSELNFTLFKRKRLSTKQFAVFCRQMSTLIKAGVTIVNSIAAIASQGDNPLLTKVLNEIKQDLEGGRTFSEACNKHPEFFPIIFINMVEAGEESGKLDHVMENLSKYFESQADIQEKVKSATTYPAFIAVLAVIVITVLMVTVIPSFAELFADSKVELPLITRMTLGVSNFVAKYFLLVSVAAIAAGIALNKYLSTLYGRQLMQRFSLRIPKFGVIFKNAAMERFSRSLSILVSSGVPMVKGLVIVSAVVDNVEFSDAILKARKGVTEGFNLSHGLALSPHFSALMLNMLRVGEDSGAMDEMLGKVADFYEAEVRYTVERLSMMIEPILIVGLAGIVGLVLASVMLPMFQMGDLIEAAIRVVRG